MKKLLLFLFFIAVTAAMFAQVTDSTATVTYTFGESFMEFLKKSWEALAAVLLFFISEWLGENKNIKANGVLRLIVNFLKSFVQKKSNVVAKLILITVILSGIGLAAAAQEKSKWDGFFKPLDNPPMKYLGTNTMMTKWVFRPAVEISAMRLTYNKEIKGFEAATLQQGGVGVSYQKLSTINDDYYMSYGFTGLVLFDMVQEGDITKAGISAAATLSILRVMNFGGGYNFTTKTPFILTGVTYNFN